ncbi:50S ribosomal protein L23 [Chromobacterium sp. Panama]|uniref:50S ribosomal protein L23 n=1 Tax=Chromobacterium sp. Panama TaxID=2161826 RepID=UPI000D3114D4|nr:50S ribosomal protein L23 [Chromobacterium sp. Panama]PTU63627.1 50S ribosomal protein L23 [Chromobacterium sp. Panama]
MNQERLLQVILAPIVSEKSTMIAEKSQQMAFRVAKDATKPEIKAAVEMLFNVKVEGVSTVNVKGKVKRFGRSIGRRSDWKKAYVSLVEGQEIDLTATPAAAE